MFNRLQYDILGVLHFKSHIPHMFRTHPPLHKVTSQKRRSPTTAAKMSPPLLTRSCPAPAALVAAAEAAELAELATLLALDMTDERLLDMEERIEEVLASALLPKLLMADEIDVDVDFMVLFPAAPVDAHTAAVCVNVTPAGVQMPLAYLRVAATGKGVSIDLVHARMREVQRSS